MNLILIIITITLIPFISAIYDGYKAEQYQFPYIVLINSPQFYCAGVLISKQHILTAAHCLMSVPTGGSIKVSLGVYEYYGSSYSDGELIKSKKFWIHEKFSMPSAVNDIGLIELPKPIVPSNKVNFIGIDNRNYPDYDQKDTQVVIAGWGFVKSQQIAKQLRYTNMTLMPLYECMKYSSHYIESLTNNHICVTKITGFPCNGDSGTPLVSTKSGKIVGILSYVKDAENGVDLGKNDCKSNVPAVATRIAFYLDWIAERSGLKFKRV
ncbi:mite allergen Der p 3-like isoform X2 [Chironomus tepperi]|uniref:mite allergen Der p 3-like isoform X2 n=1 Tax=Chironomus tepperi TaxID=113505 RepID=UPI00391F00BB